MFSIGGLFFLVLMSFLIGLVPVGAVVWLVHKAISGRSGNPWIGGPEGRLPREFAQREQLRRERSDLFEADLKNKGTNAGLEG